MLEKLKKLNPEDIAFIPVLLGVAGWLLLYTWSRSFRLLDAGTFESPSIQIMIVGGSFAFISTCFWYFIKRTYLLKTTNRTRAGELSFAIILFIPLMFIFTNIVSNVFCIINGELDISKAAVHEMSIVGKSEIRHMARGSRTIFIIQTESWRDGKGHEVFEINEDEYQKVVPHQDRLLVITKPGHFNFEWIVKREFVWHRV